MNVTLVGDIAGRVSESADGADRVTACTVCLPSGALKALRRRTLSLPKWKECSEVALNQVFTLLAHDALSISVVTLAKNVRAWQVFHTDGADAHRRISNAAKGSIAILRPATMVKFALFSMASTLAVAHAVKIGTIFRPASHSRRLQVTEDHIYDNDIQGEEAIGAFADTWRARNEQQPLTRSIGLDVKARTLRIATEQNEPLILLADYVAGVAHAVHSEVDTLSKSAITSENALRAHDKLSGLPKYHETIEPFSLRYYDIYPDFAPLQ